MRKVYPRGHTGSSVPDDLSVSPEKNSEKNQFPATSRLLQSYPPTPPSAVRPPPPPPLADDAVLHLRPGRSRRAAAGGDLRRRERVPVAEPGGPRGVRRRARRAAPQWRRGPPLRRPEPHGPLRLPRHLILLPRTPRRPFLLAPPLPRWESDRRFGFPIPNTAWFRFDVNFCRRGSPI